MPSCCYYRHRERRVCGAPACITVIGAAEHQASFCAEHLDGIPKEHPAILHFRRPGLAVRALHRVLILIRNTFKKGA
jgi:hypothetical protein